ncbi:hypothetical protein FRB99_008394 [Tulasnella sp. 403]|nr:hypothetical protein FRB99_008394 [Tulasnella sp. 403]
MTEPQADSFVGPEGVYTQTEEHKPTLVSSTLTNTNGPAAAQIATKLGFVTVTFPALKVTSSQSFTSLLGGGNKGEKKEGKKAQSQQPVLPAVQDRDESVSSGEGGAADTGGVGETNAGQAGSDVPPATNPSSTDPPHTLLFSPSLPQNLPKRKSTRNKQNLKTTTSSFVTRYHAIEGLSKWFAAKVGQTTFVFYNAGKSVYFNEAETGAKHKEPLVRVTFSAWPTCHAINQNTASSAGVDIIIGFNTGDLMWFDPLTTRYVRLNKQGCISNSPCTAVHWVPGSRSLFLVSHANGTIVVYDKDREDDVNFQPSLPPIGVPATAPVPANPPSPVVSPRQINSSEDNAQAQETPPIAEAVATPADTFISTFPPTLHPDLLLP